MKGYVIRRFTGAGGRFNRLNIPIVPGRPATRTALAPDIDLICWGASPGDAIVSTGESSTLVMYGYITEFPDGRVCDTQYEAAAFLRLQIERCLGDEAGVESFMRKMNGCFSLVYVNHKDSLIVAVTDRVTSHSIWTGEKGGRLAIGSNPLSVATAVDADSFDPGGLGSLMLYGTQVNHTRSPYEGIHGIDSGVIKTYYPGCETVTRRWHIFKHVPDYRMKRGGWVDFIAERLEGAASRILRVSPELIVFLSGGLDSRLVCSALRAAGGEPLTVTMADSDNIELSIARKTASALECWHETIIRDRYWYLDTIDDIVMRSAGIYDWDHAHFSRAYIRLLRNHMVDAALLGNGCEAFNKLLHEVSPEQTHIWSDDEFADCIDTIYPSQYAPKDRESTLSVFTPAARSRVEESLRANIIEMYRVVRDVSPDPRIVMSQFYRWHAMPSGGPSFNNIDLAAGGPERSIMLDKDMLDIHTVLPSNMRDHAGLGTALIGRLWPRAARVVYANTLLPPYFPQAAHQLSRFIRPRIGSVRRMFRPSFRSSGSWSNLGYLYGRDPRWNREISEILLDPELFPAELFDHRAIRDKWDRLVRGDYRLEFDIARLFLVGKLNALKRAPVMSGMEEKYEHH